MKLYTPAERLYASNYAVAKDLFNEKNFEKAVMGPLKEVRNLVGDGLFTAYPGEHNWERMFEIHLLRRITSKVSLD